MADGGEAEPPVDRFGRDRHRHPMQWDAEPLGRLQRRRAVAGADRPRGPQRRRPARRPGLDPQPLPRADRPAGRARRPGGDARRRPGGGRLPPRRPHDRGQPRARTGPGPGRRRGGDRRRRARSRTHAPPERGRALRGRFEHLVTRATSSPSGWESGRTNRERKELVSDGTRAVLALVVCALALGLSACGDDEAGSGSQTLTWFIFNEPSGSPQAAAEKCVEESNGEYKIEFEFLPATADGAARAARPPARRRGRLDRHHRHGRDLDRRVRQRRLDRAVPRRRRRGGDRGRLPERGRDGLVRGPALRGAALVQHPAALVPQGPGAEPAEDLGRDDRPGRRARARRGPDPGPGRTGTRASSSGSTR